MAIKIEFRGAVGTLTVRTRVRHAMQALVDALPVRPTTVRADFADENGPKGGRAVRCALEVRLPRRAPVHVEAVDLTPRAAFDAALAKLERQIGRVRETSRVLKRRPKKYYAARRALTS